MSGAEILSMLRFNRVEAIPVEVGPNFISVTLRGTMTADRFYKTETSAVELPNACN